MAPKTYTQMTKTAWDYFARFMLNDPKLKFQLLCDDTEWKLKLWCITASLCWSGTRGLRNRKIKVKGKKGPSKGTLDDEDLICMGPEDGWRDVNTSPEEDVPNCCSDDGVNNMVCPLPTYYAFVLLHLIYRSQHPQPRRSWPGSQ